MLCKSVHGKRVPLVARVIIVIIVIIIIILSEHLILVEAIEIHIITDIT